MMTNSGLLLGVAVLLLSSVVSISSQSRQHQLPIIDMHIHAEPLSEFGGAIWQFVPAIRS
jgi:hypothetical protein